MKFEHHVTFSVIISGILYAIFKSWGLTIASLISGIFIDLDHIIDYLREYGLPIEVRKFIYVCNKEQFRRLLLILHGWEWLIFLGAIAKLTDWNLWVTGLLIGYWQHIVLDQLSNNASLLGYSLFWRWGNRFDIKALHPEAN